MPIVCTYRLPYWNLAMGQRGCRTYIPLCGGSAAIDGDSLNPGEDLSRDRNSHGSGMPSATTTSRRPSFSARGIDAVIGSRGNAGWTRSFSAQPCPCKNCSRGPSCRKDLERISAECSLVCPPTTQSVKGLNWTELRSEYKVYSFACFEAAASNLHFFLLTSAFPIHWASFPP